MGVPLGLILILKTVFSLIHTRRGLNDGLSWLLQRIPGDYGLIMASIFVNPKITDIMPPDAFETVRPPHRIMSLNSPEIKIVNVQDIYSQDLFMSPLKVLRMGQLNRSWDRHSLHRCVLPLALLTYDVTIVNRIATSTL